VINLTKSNVANAHFTVGILQLACVGDDKVRVVALAAALPRIGAVNTNVDPYALLFGGGSDGREKLSRLSGSREFRNICGGRDATSNGELVFGSESRRVYWTHKSDASGKNIIFAPRLAAVLMRETMVDVLAAIEGTEVICTTATNTEDIIFLEDEVDSSE
jgi:hypothetical protein